MKNWGSLRVLKTKLDSAHRFGFCISSPLKLIRIKSIRQNLCQIYLLQLQTLDRNTKLTARNGKRIDALVVFAHSLRYLKDWAIEIIRERTGDEKYNEKDIRWVMTVPAIWRPAAKQFMREAACKVITEKLHKFAFPSLRWVKRWKWNKERKIQNELEYKPLWCCQLLTWSQILTLSQILEVLFFFFLLGSVRKKRET